MTKSFKKMLPGFVGLGALLLSPFSVLTVSAAQVPCGYAGSNRYNCAFWTKAPIEGESNGTIARGTNWIVCQAKGKTVTVNGWRNNWWARTLRDSGTGTYGSGWGWVNAVYARGGDDFEGFRNVPWCYGPPLPPQDPFDWR